MNTTTIIWSLPIIFMFHDFEEIIMITAWQTKNEKKLATLPFKPFHHWKSPDSGTVAVLIEFFILISVAFITSISQFYLLWLIFSFIFTLHFLAHFFFSFKFQGYVPGITTTIFFAPVSLYTFFYMWGKNSYHFLQILPIFLISIMISGIFFYYLTKSIALFAKMLNNYSKLKE